MFKNPAFNQTNHFIRKTPPTPRLRRGNVSGSDRQKEQQPQPKHQKTGRFKNPQRNLCHRPTTIAVTEQGVAPLGLEIYFERFSTKVSPRRGFFLSSFGVLNTGLFKNTAYAPFKGKTGLR
jgi:hypothetical protein